MTINLIVNLVLALGLCAMMYWQRHLPVSFAKRLFTGLGLGVLLGLL